MKEPSHVLEKECRAFTEFLTGMEPTPYVHDLYVDAHARVDALMDGDVFDGLLVRIARAHSSLTLVVDAYARFFARRSLLRNKLVLLLAILETTGPFCRVIDETESGHPMLVLSKLLLRCAVSLAALVVGTVALLPVQMLLLCTKRAL